MLIIVPWMIRNHTVHGQWIPIKSTFWVNVWKGNNPNATGTDRLEMADTTKSKLSLTEVTDTMSDIPHQYDALTPDQRAQLELCQPEAAREKNLQTIRHHLDLRQPRQIPQTLRPNAWE